MIKLSEIEWGPIDAADPDEDFLEKFIEPQEIKSLIGEDICLIPGEKGSGKTALCKALELRYRQRFSGLSTIRFDDLEFSPVVKGLSELSSLTSIDRFTFIANYWQYVLIVNAMKEYFSRKSMNLSVAETRIKSYLLKHHLVESGPLSIMLFLCTQCWVIMSSLTDPKKLRDPGLEIMPSNLEPQVIEELKKYPIFDLEFSEAQKDFADILRKKKERVLITLDGLDRLNTKSDDKLKENLQIIFDGLGQSVYDLSISNRFKNLIQIKCMIPYDRFIRLNIRDLDKLMAKTQGIRWSYESLQSFLARRIARHPKYRHLTSFKHLWSELFPETLRNKFYEINEDTFEYILRHTMYRPRHLQVHLLKLARRYPDSNMDKTMIAKSIRESCKELAETYIKEYEVDHPNLEAFLKKLRKVPNVMPYRDFRKIVKNMLRLFDVKMDVDKKVDTLYQMSFFGVIVFLQADDDRIERVYRYTPPRKTGVPPYRVDFHYTESKVSVTSELREDDLIAIHPIFFDYCQQKPHDSYIVG